MSATARFVGDCATFSKKQVDRANSSAEARKLKPPPTKSSSTTSKKPGTNYYTPPVKLDMKQSSTSKALDKKVFDNKYPGVADRLKRP